MDELELTCSGQGLFPLPSREQIGKTGPEWIRTIIDLWRPGNVLRSNPCHVPHDQRPPRETERGESEQSESIRRVAEDIQRVYVQILCICRCISLSTLHLHSPAESVCFALFIWNPSRSIYPGFGSVQKRKRTISVLSLSLCVRLLYGTTPGTLHVSVLYLYPVCPPVNYLLGTSSRKPPPVLSATFLMADPSKSSGTLPLLIFSREKKKKKNTNWPLLQKQYLLKTKRRGEKTAGAVIHFWANGSSGSSAASNTSTVDFWCTLFWFAIPVGK